MSDFNKDDFKKDDSKKEVLKGNIVKCEINNQTIYDMRNANSGHFTKSLKEGDIVIWNTKKIYQTMKDHSIRNIFKNDKQKAISIISEINSINV